MKNAMFWGAAPFSLLQICQYLGFCTISFFSTFALETQAVQFL
jgi:hypothetical protein